MPEINYADVTDIVKLSSPPTNLTALKYSLRIIAALAKMHGGDSATLRIPYTEIDTEETFDLVLSDTEQDMIIERKVKDKINA